jgi:protoporphyrin/coproporphyrin ferrochelatase
LALMQKRAVLLVNLGSPDSTAVPDVRRYLREFLGDSRVIDAPPQPFRRLLVNGIIVPFRAPKSAHAYASIWTEQGSPLIVTSRSVRDKLATSLGSSADVRLAMRYGTPSIRSVLQQMAADGVTETLLFPQYPHYAMSSWETVVAEVYAQAREVAPAMKIDLVQPFFRDADYIRALAAVSQPYLNGGYDYVLFSYHGIPVRHLRKADSSRAHCTVVGNCCDVCSPVQETCYRAQCLATTREFVKHTGIAADKHSVSFQSRLAGEPWLSPYTDHELERLAKAGVKRLLVMTPAFVTDCLETLEEISVEGRDTFLEAGGESFKQIPCLNDQEPYIAFMRTRVDAWLGGQSTQATRDTLRQPASERT